MFCVAFLSLTLSCQAFEVAPAPGDGSTYEMAASPTGPGALAFGACVRLLARSGDMARCEVLDGPLKGATVAVRADRLRPAKGEPLMADPPKPTPGFACREVRLAKAAVPVYLNARSMGLHMISSAPETEGGPMRDAPIPTSAAVVMGDVRAKVVGDAVYVFGNGPDARKRIGSVVELLGGVGKGKLVCVLDAYVVEVPTRTDALRAEAARQRAKRSARVRAGKAREAAAEAADERERAAYLKALPVLIQQQRLQIEAMDRAARNAAMHRLAKAAEREAAAAEYRAGMPRTVGPDGTVQPQ